MESKLCIRLIGNYRIIQASFDENCSECHNVDCADVLINGICGRCLSDFYAEYREIVRWDPQFQR